MASAPNSLRPRGLNLTGLVVLAAGLLLLSACGDPGDGASPEDRLQAVTTYSIVYDFVREVGGDRVQVTSLVPLGQDPHTYEPTPADIRAVAQSDVVFYHGLNLELWFDRLVQNAGGERPVVVVSEGIEPRLVDAGSYAGFPDPHAWMDVTLAMRYVANIRDALVALDPDGREVYETNAARYLFELEELDQWIRQQVATIPPENRKLVTTEDAFHYFARAYGFRVVGFLVYLAPEDEPSARHLADLVERIRAEQVPAVFIESTLDPRLLQRISEEAGAAIGGRVYVDSLGEPGSDADTYIRMMRRNVETFVEHLGGGSR